MSLNIRHWSIKQHVEHWIELNDLSKLAVVGASPGSKIVTIYLLHETMTGKEFREKYVQLETKYFIGYITTDDYPYKVWINFKRKTY